MNNELSKLKINDEYYTPDWVWDCLIPYIPNDKIIWEAFCNDNIKSRKSAVYLKDKGFNVICNGLDFFNNDFGDIVISNPPYSIKQKVLKRLFTINKPFMLILPNIILNTKYFIEWAKKDKDIQIIILPKRVDFIKETGGKSKSTFHTLVICWKMNLNDRLIFL
tara:strand:+ start:29 stop:520 length:492 start_codon:yes stop_codon:yes gene_type:complete